MAFVGDCLVCYTGILFHMWYTRHPHSIWTDLKKHMLSILFLWLLMTFSDDVTIVVAQVSKSGSIWGELRIAERTCGLTVNVTRLLTSCSHHGRSSHIKSIVSMLALKGKQYNDKANMKVYTLSYGRSRSQRSQGEMWGLWLCPNQLWYVGLSRLQSWSVVILEADFALCSLTKMPCAKHCVFTRVLFIASWAMKRCDFLEMTFSRSELLRNDIDWFPCILPRILEQNLKNVFSVWLDGVPGNNYTQ